MLFRCLFGILFLLSFVTVRSADGGDASRFYKVVERQKLKDIPMYYKGQEYRYNGVYADDYCSANRIIELFKYNSELKNVVNVNNIKENLHSVNGAVCCVYVRFGDVDVPYNKKKGDLDCPLLVELLNNMCFPSKVVFEDGLIPCNKGVLKIIDVDGNEEVIDELDIHDYVYNKCTLRREMFHSGILFDSFLSYKFYKGLFGRGNLKPIVSYSISGIETRVKGILKPVEIERIIEAVRNSKNVVIGYSNTVYFNFTCDKYSSLDDIGIFTELFGDEVYKCSVVGIYNSLSTVGDLKRFIADLSGINMVDIDILQGGNKLQDKVKLVDFGNYVFKFDDKYRSAGYKVLFECEDKSKKLRLDIIEGGNEMPFSFSSIKKETISDSLRKRFAFLNNVDFDVKFTDEFKNQCDCYDDKAVEMHVTIKSYTDDILEKEGSTYFKIFLCMPGFFLCDVNVPVNVTTLEDSTNVVKYSDLIDGLKKIIDFRYGVGTAQKSTYRLYINRRLVELVNGMIPVDVLSSGDVSFVVNHVDFTNKIIGCGVSVYKTGKDDKDDNGVVGCCNSCKCCG